MLKLHLSLRNNNFFLRTALTCFIFFSFAPQEALTAGTSDALGDSVDENTLHLTSSSATERGDFSVFSDEVLLEIAKFKGAAKLLGQTSKGMASFIHDHTIPITYVIKNKESLSHYIKAPYGKFGSIKIDYAMEPQDYQGLVKSNPDIYEIFFGKETVKAESAQCIFSELGKLTYLKKLDLSDNRIGELGARALAPSLGKLINLEGLDLSWNDLGPSGAVALTSALGELTGLKNLDLSYNRIGEAGIIALAPNLGKFLCLEDLDLSNNDLGDAGAIALESALGQLTRLKKLYLSDNKIGKPGILALASILGQLENLESLDLSWNRTGDTGISSLASSLGKLPRLEDLNLSGNNIYNIGVIALAPELEKLPRLKKLYLSGNHIGKSGASSLGKLSPLELLDLENNYIQAAALMALTPELTKVIRL